MAGASGDAVAESDCARSDSSRNVVSFSPDADIPGPSARTPRHVSSNFDEARRGSRLLDFIDEVSEGISSYLIELEKRESGVVVYDRHGQPEASRWRACLRRICSHARGSKEAGARADTEGVEREGPSAGSGASPAAGRLGAGPLSAALGPCRPPKDVVFEPPKAAQVPQPSLLFSACFESGNLAMAKRESPTKYTLLLDFDVNTLGYTQWFYFAVRGGSKGWRVSFCIANMSKASSLFGSQGMRPVVWSELSGRGWERGCDNVQYYPSEHKSQQGERANQYYSLAFSYTFEHDGDTVFFAHHYPYTYSYLQEYLGALLAHPYAARFARRGVLCKTISGVDCELLEVSEAPEPPPGDRPASAGPRPASAGPRKPLAVVTARVHPGESNASWMMHGFVQFLCSPAPEAQLLRQACDWLLVPMLNPDGVIHGNYRCGLAGLDLNRNFMLPDQSLHPTIFSLKKRLFERQVDLYLDFHGHSKKEGIFFYGGRHPRGDPRNAEIQLLPHLCCLGSEDFSLQECVFKVQKSKLSTARLVGFLELGIAQAYTVEASFSSSGPQCGNGSSTAAAGPAGQCDLRTDADTVVEANGDDPSGLSDAGPLDTADAVEDFRESPSDEARACPRDLASELLSLPLSLSGLWQRPPRARPGSRLYCSSANSEAPSDDDGCRDEKRYSSDDEPFRPGAGAARGGGGPQPAPPAEPPAGGARPPGWLAPEPSPVAGRTVHAAEARAAARAPPGGRGQGAPGAPGPPQPASGAGNFTPARLELAGPAIGRALAASWELTKRSRLRQAQSVEAEESLCDLEVSAAVAPMLLDGHEAAAWPHLHYERLTAETAKEELDRLLKRKGGAEERDDDSDGSLSDSQPSGDGKSAEELRRVHQRILAKLKRRQRKLAADQTVECRPEPQIEYRTMIAFGRTVRIPITKRPKPEVRSVEEPPPRARAGSEEPAATEASLPSWQAEGEAEQGADQLAVAPPLPRSVCSRGPRRPSPAPRRPLEAGALPVQAADDDPRSASPTPAASYKCDATSAHSVHTAPPPLRPDRALRPDRGDAGGTPGQTCRPNAPSRADVGSRTACRLTNTPVPGITFNQDSPAGAPSVTSTPASLSPCNNDLEGESGTPDPSSPSTPASGVAALSGTPASSNACASPALDSRMQQLLRILEEPDRKRAQSSLGHSAGTPAGAVTRPPESPTPGESRETASPSPGPLLVVNCWPDTPKSPAEEDRPTACLRPPPYTRRTSAAAGATARVKEARPPTNFQMQLPDEDWPSAERPCAPIDTDSLTPLSSSRASPPPTSRCSSVGGARMCQSPPPGNHGSHNSNFAEDGVSCGPAELPQVQLPQRRRSSGPRRISAGSAPWQGGLCETPAAEPSTPEDAPLLADAAKPQTSPFIVNLHLFDGSDTRMGAEGCIRGPSESSGARSRRKASACFSSDEEGDDGDDGLCQQDCGHFAARLVCAIDAGRRSSGGSVQQRRAPARSACATPHANLSPQAADSAETTAPQGPLCPERAQERPAAGAADQGADRCRPQSAPKQLQHSPNGLPLFPSAARHGSPAAAAAAAAAAIQGSTGRSHAGGSKFGRRLRT